MDKKGLSYIKRVKEINDIYDKYARSGLTNREILRRYIWPVYAISEKTFYNYINALADPYVAQKIEELKATETIENTQNRMRL